MSVHDQEPHQIAGAAITAGFVLLLALLYRDPRSGLAAASVDPMAMLYFLVVPVIGLVTGAYDYLDGPYSGGASFVLASYLGISGLTVTLGDLLGPALHPLLLMGGLMIVVLSVIGLLAGTWRWLGGLNTGLLRSPRE